MVWASRIDLAISQNCLGASDNTACIRTFERLGFTLEGRLRATWKTHIGIRDSLIFAMIDGEYAEPAVDGKIFETHGRTTGRPHSPSVQSSSIQVCSAAKHGGVTRSSMTSSPAR